MRDQIGLGESFNAGQHSTNVGNSNQGWIFEEISEENPERGILGADQILCDGATIILDPFTNASNISYEWNDGNTATSLTLTNPGLFWVDLTFADNCALRDSVTILPQVYSNTDLGEDLTLCEGVEITLDAFIEDGTYIWQDGSVEDTLVITDAGQYYVDVTYLGCNNSDTVNIAYDARPQPNLGVDRLACKDEVVRLMPNTSY